MHEDIIRDFVPRRYFNPERIVKLEGKTSDFGELATEGTSLYIQKELRDARLNAESMAKS